MQKKKTWWLALVLAYAGLGSGCTALIIGGAAAGGYAVGKDERPVGQIVDDGTVTASIKSKLIADKYVPAGSINVDTFEGRVTLNGTVKSYVARSQAEKLARETKGVREVVNNLEVVDE
jgi:hyperosmotically inducible protein